MATGKSTKTRCAFYASLPENHRRRYAAVIGKELLGFLQRRGQYGSTDFQYVYDHVFFVTSPAASW
jgi:hypothetical protein